MPIDRRPRVSIHAAPGAQPLRNGSLALTHINAQRGIHQVHPRSTRDHTQRHAPLPRCLTRARASPASSVPIQNRAPVPDFTRRPRPDGRAGGRARGARRLEPATKEIIMATSALPGNGEHVLVHGDHEAIIVEAGAGVRSYTLDAVPVVAGYPPEAVCPSGRGQWLVPWP